MADQNTYTAFDGTKMLFHGTFPHVVLKIKKKIGKEQNSSILIFSDSTGKTMDFNFHGHEDDVLKRLEIYTTEKSIKEENGPGRPKLGVISREISLLPRHWEWLANQSSGASATLRLLIEAAMKKTAGTSEVKLAQERTYKFMATLAGDLQNYEEALRALYKKDSEKFETLIEQWPKDVRAYAEKLSEPVFAY